MHTQESNFVRIANGLDVDPLLELLDAKPELWKEIQIRQQFTGSPHKDTESMQLYVGALHKRVEGTADGAGPVIGVEYGM